MLHIMLHIMLLVLLMIIRFNMIISILIFAFTLIYGTNTLYEAISRSRLWRGLLQTNGQAWSMRRSHILASTKNADMVLKELPSILSQWR